MPESDKLFQIKYGPPYSGIYVTDPENEIPPTATPDAVNIWTRNNELQTRPKTYRLIAGPGDGYPIRALSSFLDGNYFVHTVAVTATGLWQLSPNWPVTTIPDWNQIGAFSSPSSDVPYPSAVFINKFYFCNSGTKLYYWDGVQNNIQTATEVAGGLFLCELDAHLIMAYTQELVGNVVTPFPQRVRWSVSGNTIDASNVNQNAWNPATNVGAGFNDSLDVPDEITGLVPMGRTAYLLRRNGITQITPVGKGSQPFNFDHMWASDTGVGCIYPNATASYGTLAIFISSEDIYSMSPSAFSPISQNARDAIFADLQAAVGDPIGSITPRYRSDYIYLKYDLMIPVAGGMKVWTYDINKKHWMPQFFGNRILTTRMRHTPTQ